MAEISPVSGQVRAPIPACRSMRKMIMKRKRICTMLLLMLLLTALSGCSPWPSALRSAALRLREESTRLQEESARLREESARLTERLLPEVRAALNRQIGRDTSDTSFLDRVGGYYGCTMLHPEEKDIHPAGIRAADPHRLLFGFSADFSRIDLGNVWTVWYLVETDPSQEGSAFVRRFYTELEYRAAFEGP